MPLFLPSVDPTKQDFLLRVSACPNPIEEAAKKENLKKGLSDLRPSVTKTTA